MKAGDNPFRTERLERVRFHLPAGVTWEGLMARLRELQFRAAIVGPHGSGKTTFLDHLLPRVAAEGFQLHHIRLTEEHSLSRCAAKELFPQRRASELIVLDGAEQMNPLSWCWFRWRARRAGGLIITTHRAGRLPTLIEFQPTVQLLGELIYELAPDASHMMNPRALFAAHGGNLRHALFACYDQCNGSRSTSLLRHRA